MTGIKMPAILAPQGDQQRIQKPLLCMRLKKKKFIWPSSFFLWHCSLIEMMYAWLTWLQSLPPRTCMMTITIEASSCTLFPLLIHMGFKQKYKMFSHSLLLHNFLKIVPNYIFLSSL